MTTSGAQRVARACSWGLTLLLLGLGCATGFVREYSGDFHYHVVQGEWTLAHHRVFRYDVFSHTFAGKPMFVSAWLGDVLLALAFRHGYLACFAVRGLCITLALGITLVEMRRLGVRVVTAAALLLVLLAQSFFVFYLRPEMFSLPLFAGLLALLSAHQRSRRLAPLAGALALLALWANLHGSSSVGLLAVGCYAAELGLRALLLSGPRRARARAVTFAVGLVACAFLAISISPEGFGTPLAFRILSARCNDQPEWLPITWASSTAIVRSGAAVLLLTSLLAGRRLSPWRALLTLVLAVVAVEHRRFLTVTLLAAAPLLAGNLAALSARLDGKRASTTLRTLAVAATATWGLMVLLTVRHLAREVGAGIDPGAYPEAACRFVRTARLPGKMLNAYDIGSYLMYCLQPSATEPEPIPVSIDQRACSLYPGEFYARYHAAVKSPEAVRALADELDASWAFVLYDPWARRLAADPRTWRLVYFDDQALIYVRADRPETAEVARARGLRHLDPARIYQLPDERGASLVEARAELDRQRAACPRCYRTLLAQAALAVAGGDARAMVDGAAQLEPFGETPEVVFLAARYALARGQTQKAIALLDRFVAVGGDPLLAAAWQAMARSGAAK